ncbi:unnamed protein product, partial [Tuber aestivum]
FVFKTSPLTTLCPHRAQSPCPEIQVWRPNKQWILGSKSAFRYAWWPESKLAFSFLLFSDIISCILFDIRIKIPGFREPSASGPCYCVTPVLVQYQEFTRFST